MAADETLLATAQRGQASLRFYRWTEPTVSLGYFEPSLSREEKGLAHLAFVRRPSGGGTLVHHHELTYCLAVPLSEPWTSQEKWMPRMHRLIVAALEELRVKGLELVESEARLGSYCFQHFTPGDVLCKGKKIVGSAQRKQRGCLMQHGGILLARSEHTPDLPGIFELANLKLDAEDVASAIVQQFEADTGWNRNPTYWDAQEQADMHWFIENRYANPAWNEKR